MPYYVTSRTKKDEKTDNWVIQSESFRLKKDALVATKHITLFDEIREAGGKVSVFSVTDLKLLGVEVPKPEEPKIPNVAWLYSHTDYSRTRPVLGNIHVLDLEGRGRYAIAADGFVIGAMPTDLEVGEYPGKDGNVYKGSPYPKYESIIPANSQIGSIFHVSTVWLNSALKRAKVFAGQSLHGNRFIKGVGKVTLTVRRESKSVYKISGSNATLSVFGMATNIGESLDMLPCFLEGNPLEVAYNVDYLLNALRGWKGHTQKPTHEFTQIQIPMRSHDPMIIEPYSAPIVTEDERLPFAVIMPMSKGI